MADGNPALHKEHEQQREQEARLQFRRRRQPPEDAAPDRVILQQQRQPPKRQRGEHRVALRPAAGVQQHRRREHAGQHRAHRRARLCAARQRQLQNRQRRRRLAGHVKQLDGVHLREGFQPGNQRHHDQIAARPRAVLPRHRRAEVVIPHVLQHRREHLAHAPRLDIQHRQMRRHRQHGQQRRAQQHDHRFLPERAPRTGQQQRRAARADQRDHRRALHCGAELERQREKRERQRRAQRQPLGSPNPRLHPRAKRVPHPCPVHHAFTSVSTASVFPSCRLLYSAAAVSATAAP